MQFHLVSLVIVDFLLTIAKKLFFCFQKRRIVGGVETGVNEFPAMAGLVDAQIKQVYCGASVISDRYALTAAHCLFKRVEIIGLLVGDHDLTTGRCVKFSFLH